MDELGLFPLFVVASVLRELSSLLLELVAAFVRDEGVTVRVDDDDVAFFDVSTFVDVGLRSLLDDDSFLVDGGLSLDDDDEF